MRKFSAFCLPAKLPQFLTVSCIYYSLELNVQPMYSKAVKVKRLEVVYSC